MKRIVVVAVLSCLGFGVDAQNIDAQIDTLPAALKVEEAISKHHATGVERIDPIKSRGIISAIGEGDIIKCIQTLPGVSQGVEGGSAFFVRGGNNGNNLMTIDGLPVYASSHLLGLTTVFSPDIVEESQFQIGGFCGEDNNFTSSHIKLITKNGDFSMASGSASISNFLISGSVTAPVVKDKLSVFASARISPIGLEYKLFKPLLDKYQSEFTDFSSWVHDVYGKLSWKINEGNMLSFSVFNSVDSYSYGTKAAEQNGMGWNNLLMNLQWDVRFTSSLNLKANLSYDGSQSFQNKDVRFSAKDERFVIRNDIRELQLNSALGLDWGLYSSFDAGFRLRGSFMNPGTKYNMEGSSEQIVTDKSKYNFMATAHIQYQFMNMEHFEARIAGRLNYFAGDIGKDIRRFVNPEGSLSVCVWAGSHIGFEATLDHLVQYYHTLEGTPTGWSLDMIVPSGRYASPEMSNQAYGGVISRFGKHNARIGGYYKMMSNLVFYKDAASYFSSSLSGWEGNLDIGDGESYGLECRYEKTGEIFNCSVAYTLSKTDRHFENVNRGERFPAKFDRRHILNVNAACTFLKTAATEFGLSTFFTFQSGNWESLQDGQLPVWLLAQKNPELLKQFVSSENNYQMPDYIRWDASLFLRLHSSNIHHYISLGVYNLLNRHNPIAIRYNQDTGKWQTISILPILPSFSYRVEF